MEKAICDLNADLFLKELKCMKINYLHNENVSNELVDEANGMLQQKEFFVKVVGLITKQLLELNKKLVTCNDSSEIPTLVCEDIQFLEPRGKFKISIYTDKIVAEGKLYNFQILSTSISHLLCVPNHTSTNKEGIDIFVLYLNPCVIMNGKETKSVVLNLRRISTKSHGAVDGKNENESVLVTNAIKALSGKTIFTPISKYFEKVSNPMKQNKFYINCYRGTQEGVLYLLESGLMFIKPVIFIPIEEISSLSAGRGGAAGNTRYVDLKIEKIDNSVIEFGNIDRETLWTLQLYIVDSLEWRREDKKKVKSEAKVEVNLNEEVDDDDDDEEDDDDYNPDEHSSDSESEKDKGSDDEEKSVGEFNDDDSNSDDDSMDSGDYAIARTTKKVKVNDSEAKNVKKKAMNIQSSEGMETMEMDSIEAKENDNNFVNKINSVIVERDLIARKSSQDKDEKIIISTELGKRMSQDIMLECNAEDK